MTDRRAFAGWAVTALLGQPVIAMAQQMGKVSRVGAVVPWDRPTPEAIANLVESERPRFRALGWVEGENLFVDRRFAGSDPTRWRQAAAELKALQVALIVTTGTPATIRAVLEGAPGVPIVMVNVGDPVASGFAVSLARPGGDLTGTSAAGPEIVVKQLGLLLRVAPHAKKVTALISASRHESGFSVDFLTEAVKPSGVKIELVYTRVEELDAAVARAKDGVLVVIPDPLFYPHYEQIAEQAIRANVPAALPDPRFVRAGGLMSFISPYSWHWERSASYIDKILRGAKPGDLPIEQPTQFELAINLKTARAIGLTIPQSILLLANEVIQ